MMTTGVTSGRRNLTIIVLCSLLVLLFPLSVTAQEESDIEGVLFLNSETGDALVVMIEPWETPDEVDIAMRIYENDNLVEGYLGEGYEVLNSAPVSEEDATDWDIEGGLEFEIELDGDPGAMYLLPVELDVVVIMYLGESLSDRRLNRFIGNVVEDGVEVRTPRGFERVDDIEGVFDESMAPSPALVRLTTGHERFSPRALCRGVSKTTICATQRIGLVRILPVMAN